MSTQCSIQHVAPAANVTTTGAGGVVTIATVAPSPSDFAETRTLTAPGQAGPFASDVIAAVAAATPALSGTVSVTGGSTAITFTTNQTLRAGALVFFSSQPGVVYTLASAVNNSTSGTLSQAFSGSTASGLGVTAA